MLLVWHPFWTRRQKRASVRCQPWRRVEIVPSWSNMAWRMLNWVGSWHFTVLYNLIDANRQVFRLRLGEQDKGVGYLDSYETLINYARSTTTCGGLEVKTYLVKKDYPNGVKVTDEQMEQLCLKAHTTQPARNYTLNPR